MARLPRSKVKLQFIDKASSRKVSYKNRSNNLIKKAVEVSKLCGVEGCVIITNPQQSGVAYRTKVWPNHDEALRVIERFKSDTGRNLKMLNSMGYIEKNLEKQNEVVKKLEVDNKKKEMTIMMYQCLETGNVPDIPLEDLDILELIMQQTMEEMQKKLHNLQSGSASV